MSALNNDKNLHRSIAVLQRKLRLMFDVSTRLPVVQRIGGITLYALYKCTTYLLTYLYLLVSSVRCYISW